MSGRKYSPHKYVSRHQLKRIVEADDPSSYKSASISVAIESSNLVHDPVNPVSSGQPRIVAVRISEYSSSDSSTDKPGGTVLHIFDEFARRLGKWDFPKRNANTVSQAVVEILPCDAVLKFLTISRI